MTAHPPPGVRLMTGVSVAGLTLVGAYEMRWSLVLAVASVGAFGFVASVVGLWQSAYEGRRLWARAAALALRTVATMLMLVGTLVTLVGLHTAWGAIAAAAWWALPRQRPAPPGESPAEATTTPQQLEPRGAVDTVEQRGARPDVDDFVRSVGGAPLARVWTATRDGGTAEAQVLVRSFDNAALARAWSESRTAGEPSEPARRAELAAIRGMLLDEVERRDPAAFSAWLARGAPDAPPVPTPERADRRQLGWDPSGGSP